MRQRQRVGALVLRGFLLLAMGVQSPFGLTLCVADDGHANLELAHGGLACTSEIRRHHPEAAVLGEDGRARHPCRDVPLLEQASYRATDAMPLVAPSTLVLSASPAEAVRLRTFPGTASATGPPTMTTRSIRSVVILA